MSKLTLSDVVDAIRAADASVVATSEIAERTGFTRQHIDDFLRQYGDSQIESTTVGNSKAWYLNEVQHPATILEDSLDGAHLVNMPVVDCRRCHNGIEDGEELVVLFERINIEWESLDALCIDHADERVGLLSEFGFEEYIKNSTGAMEYAICRGTCESKKEDKYNRSVIRDPVLLQYFPRTEPNTSDQLRQSEPIQ